jgi:preprotein translocase subunit SecA
MGFWDRFRSPPPRATETDRVYLTKTAKLAGLAAEVSATPGPILVVAHFPQTLHEVQEALAAVGFPGERAQGPVTAADYLRRLRTDGNPLPLFALASQLRASEPAGEVGGDRLKVLVAERHFLRSHDGEIRLFAEGIGRPTVVLFFVALDEPLMKEIAGEWIGDVLRRLGMQETDAIESQMVVRRVKAAQSKYASKARGDEPAESAEQWLERNGPAK